MAFAALSSSVAYIVYALLLIATLVFVVSADTKDTDTKVPIINGNSTPTEPARLDLKNVVVGILGVAIFYNLFYAARVYKERNSYALTETTPNFTRWQEYAVNAALIATLALAGTHTTSYKTIVATATLAATAFFFAYFQELRFVYPAMGKIGIALMLVPAAVVSYIVIDSARESKPGASAAAGARLSRLGAEGAPFRFEGAAYALVALLAGMMALQFLFVGTARYAYTNKDNSGARSLMLLTRITSYNAACNLAAVAIYVALAAAFVRAAA